MKKKTYLNQHILHKNSVVINSVPNNKETDTTINNYFVNNYFYGHNTENSCPNIHECKETSKYEADICREDDNCDKGFKCCNHGCFDHKVCIRLREEFGKSNLKDHEIKTDVQEEVITGKVLLCFIKKQVNFSLWYGFRQF